MFNKDGITDHFPCLNTHMTCESWVRWQIAGSLSWDLGCTVGLDRNHSSVLLLIWALGSSPIPSAPWP